MATKIINLTSLNGRNGFRMNGTEYDYVGESVSGIGDFNGDGFSDVIVGSRFTNSNGILVSGASYVVFGKASGFDATLDFSALDGSNGFRLNGVAYSDSSGAPISSAGDINGDGFADLLISAPGADPNGNYSAGSNYVVFGRAASFDATFDLSSLNGSNGFRLDGAASGDYSSTARSAGDVNGDGFDDLIVGAYGADPNGNLSGSSYVIFGKAAGFTASINLSSLDGINGFRLDGVAEYDGFGGSVSNAGDINGDGFADFIISARGADPNGVPEAGSSYVVFGNTAGLNSTLDLSNLDGNNGFRLDGAVSRDYSGLTVRNAGDINGDGFDDLMVGAGFQFDDFSSGVSYIVFGKASGFDAAMDLSTLNGINGFRINVDTDAEFTFHEHLMDSAGDVNGDGFDDVIIGALVADPNGINNAGSSYIVFGKASGFDEMLDLSTLDSNSGFRVDGAAASNYAGAVSGAGDVNGDGFSDLLVGASGANSSYVIFGRNFNGKVTAMGTAKADKLKGSQGVDRIVAGDGDDIISGRGGKDVYHAGAGDDTIEIRDLKFQLADGGAGLDTLKLDASHLNLNLTKERGHISDIEAIDLKGNGTNKLTVTALDVLNLSSTSNTLIVDGNHNDRVVGLDSGWEDGGVHGGYHSFTNGEAVLLVGVHVATDFF